jgi:tRNA (uracil-5-)-methyltransferase TRM9
MRSETIHALNEINRRFYARAGEEFSVSRANPWSGWHRVLDLMDRCRPPGRALRILDVGCGDGRFASFLATSPGREFSYLGVDRSLEMVSAARGRLQDLGHGDLLLANLTATRALPLTRGEFDFIVAFGVLHHIPGFANRHRLLENLSRHLAPGGWLVVTVWRFLLFERFRERVVPWPDYRGENGATVDPSDLESGDCLLAWGGADRGLCRYCHFVDDNETERLLASLPLEVEATYEADGEGDRLNRYLVLTRNLRR